MNWAYDIIASVKPGSLLCFDKHRFCDPATLLKKNNRVFPGSFNPVHNAHLAVGDDAIYEICVNNFYKGLASPEDLFHRITMLSLCGRSVLLTHAQTYTEKDALFRSCVDQHYVYPIGADAWNRCIQSPGMFDGLEDSGSIFEVCTYPGELADDFDLHYLVLEVERPVIRSSSIRDQVVSGDLPDVVANYIRENNLYL